MNMKKLVKLSNIIGIVSVLLLVYWVFAFILAQVFGLKVFREHITEMFAMSVLGIIALMAGALMLNIMLNLTRIAERNQETAVAGGKKTAWLLLALFPCWPRCCLAATTFPNSASSGFCCNRPSASCKAATRLLWPTTASICPTSCKRPTRSN